MSTQTKSDFLPIDYQVPTPGGAYMKFEQGDNKFRIISKPIIGWEVWIEEDNNRKPVRYRMADKAQAGVDAKHFWAFAIWNYKVAEVQILQITQVGIQASIKALNEDTDWGSPFHYDLLIKRNGEGLETKYAVMSKPFSTLPTDIKAKIDVGLKNLNLEALFDNGNPFENATQGTIEDFETVIDPSEIPNN